MRAGRAPLRASYMSQLSADNGTFVTVQSFTGRSQQRNGRCSCYRRMGARVLSDIVDAVEDRSARGIAAAIGRLVTSGSLATNTRLPTVRSLSQALGVSPTTVSEAWQTLAAVGAIEARGRLGTFVRHPIGPGGP